VAYGWLRELCQSDEARRQLDEWCRPTGVDEFDPVVEHRVERMASMFAGDGEVVIDDGRREDR
jgi:hypothetical protein